jgi:hypothetical protein
MTPEGRGGDRRDAGEIEALVTDHYLDSLLGARSPLERGETPEREEVVARAVREASRRLAADLPRFHPSFRFEERLALRLAEMAASMRLPLAAGAEGQPVPIRRVEPAPDPLVVGGDQEAGEAGDRDEVRPLILGGAAVAASAISLAGAWLAWRRRTSPMARAIRAAHELRQPLRGA